tara:strand:- start:7518 stop:8231 length:714 start_codon:yes stop_codon:yes gene_type:complete
MSVLPLLLKGVSVHAGGQILIDGIDLEIEAGPKTVILGPNGAGKSLLLRLCHGLIGPTAGKLTWSGSDSTHARRRQGMVFQKPVMLRRSVRANIAYGLKLHEIPTAHRQERIERALAQTGLGHVAERPARVLSVGEQQRLALARAWALQPEVLFLDEPTASLDPSGTGAVERIIEDIHAAGTKIVMTTHDLAQARRVAEDVIFLHNGRLTERASPAKFFSAPESEAARAFLDGRLLW